MLDIPLPNATDAPEPLYLGPNGQRRDTLPTFRMGPDHSLVPTNEGIVMNGPYALAAQQMLARWKSKVMGTHPEA